jgi:hypothetical protein
MDSRAFRGSVVAIPFTRLRYRCLLPRAGTAAELGYIGRRRIIDRRLDLQLDFTELADDLVYEDLSLPDGAPPEFCDIETFANENDAAEMRHVRGSLDDRERSPQIGIAIVHALPPDWEITLDEAVELTGRVVKIARGEYRVGVHVAIHDPALRLPGAVNRHAHAFLSRREIRPDGFERTKIRNQTARLGSSGGSSYVAEGIDAGLPPRPISTAELPEQNA